MRKWLIVLSLLLLAVLGSGCSGDKEYSMDRADVKAYVMPDGDLYVEEIMAYTFKGQFNGMKRYIDSGQEGIEFFEAYIPPEGKPLGTFSYEGLPRLEVTRDDSNDTYYIFNSAKDETKRVYYRYRIDRAASRYSETGELDWKFFENNVQDIHHVSIDIVLPEGFKEGEVHAFLKDRTGGTLTDIESPVVHYKNEVLAANGNAEIHVLFPSSFLADMPINPANVSLTEILNREEKYAQKLAERQVTFGLAATLLHGLSIVLLFATAAVLIWWRKIPAWFGRKSIAQEEVEQIDPLAATYLYRRGKLKEKDILAGLFSLRRRGQLTLEEAAPAKRFLGDPKAPKVNLKFVFRGSPEQLPGPDRMMVKRLFTQHGRIYSYTIDKYTGPTDKERKAGKGLGAYHKRWQQLKSFHEEWYLALAESEPYVHYARDSFPPRLLIRGLAWVHAVTILCLYYMDVASRGGLVTAGGLLAAGAIWAGFRGARRWRMFVYLLGCFFAAALLQYDLAFGAYTGFLACSFVFAAAIPDSTLSWEAARLRCAICAFRRRLKAGKWTTESEPNRLERLTELSLLLEAVPSSLRRESQEGYEADSELSPLLGSAGISAFLYMQSHPPARMNHLYSSSGAGSDSGGYISGDSGGGGGDGGTGAF
ncbi:DUF2207 domain-containing protein [Brevibacillus sp. B_LB10_24]|uniref:DUF2207 domain-containing protein n=1 Tax=Brevibacillus sp. B_LB10_24 TaxID=3380645 RepID=UPI0038BA43DB